MIELATEIRWQDARFRVPMERILLTEQLGYDAVFTAEGHGSEGLVPLGYVAARTDHLKLGTRVTQVATRPPVLTAMAFQTLNHLSGGNRVIVGLGSSYPPASERNAGTAFEKPLTRMREFVAILRKAFAGEPLEHDGEVWQLPYRGPGSHHYPPIPIGLDAISPIPILVAGSGPAMVALAAEIADGWMPPGLGPGLLPSFRPQLDEGFARAGRSIEDFQIWSHVDVLVDDEVATAMRPFKEYTVTWWHSQRGFMTGRGYTELDARLAELYDASGERPEPRVQAGMNALPDGLWEEAIDAVPDDYIDEGWLVGPVERIKERAQPWFDCGLTGLIVRYGPQLGAEPVPENLEVFRALAEAAGKEPRT